MLIDDKLVLANNDLANNKEDIIRSTKIMKKNKEHFILNIS